MPAGQACASFPDDGRRRARRPGGVRSESLPEGKNRQAGILGGGILSDREARGELETRINGDTYRCGFTLAARVRNYGGDLELARGASLLNDEFETVMFEGSNPLRYAFYMMAVAVKQVQKMPGVRTVRSTRVELAGDAPIHIDGEYVGRSPATIEIVPDALTILVPESYG